MQTASVCIILAGFVCVHCDVGVCSDRDVVRQETKYEFPNGLGLYTHERPRNGEKLKPAAIHWRDLAGKRVVGQGVAWGIGAKGYGPYLMMDRSRIYMKPKTLPITKLEGKILEIHGVVVVEQKVHQAFGKEKRTTSEVIYVKVDSFKVLSRLEWPWLRPVRPLKKTSPNSSKRE